MFLPDVRLILTSRPHSILKFRKSIQPNFVLYLDDLSEEDMKVLFRFYIKTENVDEIIDKLLKKSPKIQQLTFCPLFLRLFCHLYEIVGDEIWKLVSSTSNLFDELLIRLQQSAHKGSQLQEGEVMTKLSKLAYNTTMQRSVVITQKDLSKCEITPDDVQDLMIGVNSGSSSALVGPSLFYFAHQSIQEFLTSRYAWQNLNLNKFDDFLNLVFPELDEEGNLIKGDEFSVVRMFTLSMLNILKFDSEELQTKKLKLIEKSSKHIIACHNSIYGVEHQAVIRSDFDEITNLKIINQLKEKLRNLEFYIYTYHRNVTRHVNFIEKFVSQVDCLGIYAADFNLKDLKMIAAVLTKSGIKVKELIIFNVEKYDEELFTTLFDTTNKIYLEKIIIDLNEELLSNKEMKNICAKIDSKIKTFKTENMISNNIIVEVQKMTMKEPLLEAKLRKGQSPIFVNR